ncbi:MAG: hypothetical protein F6J90_35390 [Moorea sp. SIOASIH]|uniref:hypothetical protein n=1 Tax=Moorena sp. SIOASIH TaxID=2607817 RepID=UPI0013BC743E|nr:hypothetical protein [Moorena sp. SIOASIH]NEO41328.1 hypothetical protein [Moorena sp. SIOASIH]
METRSKTPIPALYKQIVFKVTEIKHFKSRLNDNMLSERVEAIGTAKWTADFLVLRYGKSMWLLRAMPFWVTPRFESPRVHAGGVSKLGNSRELTG